MWYTFVITVNHDLCRRTQKKKGVYQKTSTIVNIAYTIDLTKSPFTIKPTYFHFPSSLSDIIYVKKKKHTSIDFYVNMCNIGQK